MAKEHKQVYSGSKVTFENTSGDVSKLQVDIKGNLVIMGSLDIIGNLESTDVTQSTLRIDDKTIILNQGEIGPGVGATSGTSSLSGLIVDRGMFEQIVDPGIGEPVFRDAPYTPATILWDETTQSWNFNSDLSALELNGDPTTPIVWQDRSSWYDPRLVNIGNPVGNHRTQLDTNPLLRKTAANVGFVADITNPIELNIDNIEHYLNATQTKTTNHIMYWQSNPGLPYGGVWSTEELRIGYDNSPALGAAVDTNGYRLTYFGNNHDVSQTSTRTSVYSTLFLSDSNVGIDAGTNPETYSNTTLWAETDITIQSETTLLDLIAGTSINVTAPDINMTGAVTITGSLTATSFSGNGAALTNLNASNIKSGTISDAHLPATISSDITGNAETATNLAIAKTINVNGAVTGTALFDGSSDITITTTATSDPMLTLSGDATGSATFTNLGNATLNVNVADDSHNHIVGNIDNFQEEVQDIVGGMITGNSETGILVTYNDALGKINFDVNDPVISLSGDATGSATMTNLGDIDIVVTVNSTSEAYDASNITTGILSDEHLPDIISSDITGNAETVTNGVYTTTNQNIAGQKTFTDNKLTVSGDSPRIELRETDADARWTMLGTFGTWSLREGIELTERLRVSPGGAIFTTSRITANSFSGDGSSLTNVTASNADKLDNLESNQFLRSDQSATMTGSLTATSFSGIGTNLTNLNATNIKSGTISDAHLPATISSDITGNAATASNADKLDNLDSTQFLRSDQSATMLGSLTTTGSVTSDHVLLKGLGPTTSPGANRSYLGGYGLLGDRDIVYVSNNSGAVGLNYAGLHNANIKLVTTNTGISVTGTVVATSFSGNGSALTNLNATNIATGTISDAHLPATISSDITGNAATASDLEDIPSGFASEYNALFNIAGSIHDTPSVKFHGILQRLTAPHFAGTSLTLSGTATANSFSGDGSSLTNVTASNADKLDNLESNQFLRSDQSATMTGSLTATSFSGIGTNLTNLNATNIKSGTISDAHLPATISSDITGNAATASNADKLDNLDSTQFLRSDQSATITGSLTATSFSGNGSALTNLNASNIKSGTISDAHLPATISSDITGNAATASDLEDIPSGFAGEYNALFNIAGSIHDNPNVKFHGFQQKLTAPHFAGTSLTLSGTATALNFAGTSLTLSGTATADAFNTSSALKYKEDVVQFSNALEKVLAIDTIYYVAKDDKSKERKIGVTAESLAKVAPEFVNFVNNEPDSVNYGQMTAMLICAIQEQEDRRIINKFSRLASKVTRWFAPSQK